MKRIFGAFSILLLCIGQVAFANDDAKKDPTKLEPFELGRGEFVVMVDVARDADSDTNPANIGALELTFGQGENAEVLALPIALGSQTKTSLTLTRKGNVLYLEARSASGSEATIETKKFELRSSAAVTLTGSVNAGYRFGGSGAIISAV